MSQQLISTLQNIKPSDLGSALKYVIKFFDEAPENVQQCAHACLFQSVTGGTALYSSTLAAYLLDHESEAIQCINVFKYISRNLKITSEGNPVRLGDPIELLSWAMAREVSATLRLAQMSLNRLDEDIDCL